MPPIQAVLLDLDGTTLNTFELMCRAFEYAFSTSNLSIPSRQLIQAQLSSGGTLETMYKNLNPLADALKLTMIHRTYESDNLQLGQPFPDTLATLERIHSAGLKLAIVSNRGSLTLHKLISINHLNEYFPIIISGEDAPHPKPDADPILLALDHLKIPPTDAVMIGDTGADILAGQHAKTRTIGLTAGFCGRSIANFHPDLVADSLSGVLPFLLLQD